MSNIIPLPLPSLRRMSNEQILHFIGKDPRKWAQAFLELYEADETDEAMNEDWVAFWFSKAMEVSKL